MSGGNSTLRKKVEREVKEENGAVKELVETLIISFLKSDSDYGAITDLNIDINRIYDIVRDYIVSEKLDVYALMLGDRILLSRTNMGFEELYEVIKGKSQPQLKRDIIEVWDDPKNKILHLIIIPFRKHFPIEYTNEKEKEDMTQKFSTMAL
jgi:hypothetical protein